jgi:hypothetical protein
MLRCGKNDKNSASSEESNAVIGEKTRECFLRSRDDFPHAVNASYFRDFRRLPG